MFQCELFSFVQVCALPVVFQASSDVWFSIARAFDAFDSRVISDQKPIALTIFTCKS